MSITTWTQITHYPLSSKTVFVKIRPKFGFDWRKCFWVKHLVLTCFYCLQIGVHLRMCLSFWVMESKKIFFFFCLFQFPWEITFIWSQCNTNPNLFERWNKSTTPKVWFHSTSVHLLVLKSALTVLPSSERGILWLTMSIAVNKNECRWFAVNSQLSEMKALKASRRSRTTSSLFSNKLPSCWSLFSVNLFFFSF